jgi:Arc/MetJ family transcription regulator
VTAKLPQQPPTDLAARRPSWHTWPVTDSLWHIANTSGPYATRFSVMRSFGPLASARFDPHPPPPQNHSTERVLYAAGDLVTALAERFQNGREIRCRQPADPIVYLLSLAESDQTREILRRTVYTALYTERTGHMTKILVDVDDELMTRAQQLLGGTKKDTVNQALSYFVRMRSQQDVLDWLRDTDPLADLRDPEVRAQARR